MLTLPDDLNEFIELLNAHEVRYLIVGGYAVAYHGYPRFTGDIDFFLDPTNENARKIEGVLIAFGFGGLSLSASDFTQPDTIVQLGYPPNRIDLLTSISGVTFAVAWEGRETIESGGLTLLFIGRQALIANKRASNRVKNIADLDALS